MRPRCTVAGVEPADAVDAALVGFFERWRARIDAGAGRLGWKIAINDPAMMRRLGLDRPIVGALTRDARLEAQGELAVAADAVLAVEPELAVYLREDVPAGAGPDRLREAVRGVGPALEILEGAQPAHDLAAVVGHNAFHRAVWLGAGRPVREGASLAGLAVRVRAGEVARTARAEDALGDLAAVVGLVVRRLARHGEALLGSDVILSGSLTPIVPLSPGASAVADFGPLGRLGVERAGGVVRPLPAPPAPD